jgi:TonB family protein
MYRRGEGVQEHPGRAHQLLRRACQGGHRPACLAVRIKVLPVRIHVPTVLYPPQSRRANISGTVRLTVTVHRSGRVTWIRVDRQPNAELGQAAVRALQRARFSPARAQNGDAVTFTIRYRYTFKLTD